MRFWMKVGACAVGLLAGAGHALARCGGSDLLGELRARDPAAFGEIRAAADAMPHGRGRLFRIAGEGRGDSYLFGTIHLSDPRVTDLPAAVRDAFDRATAVALELDTAGAAPDKQWKAMGPRLLRYVLPTTDERIETMLPDADIRRLEAAVAERGAPRSGVRSFKPAVTALTVAGTPCGTVGAGAILDERLAQNALSAGKRLAALETFEEQLASSTVLPADEQRKLIVAVVRTLDRQPDLVETMTRLYLSGDLGFLAAWMRHPRAVPDRPVEVPALFFDALLDRRNLRMRDRALPLLERGSAFIAVGAAHLPGETGLVRLIEREGYRIERVDAADEALMGE